MSSQLLSDNFIQKVRTTSKILKAVDHKFRQRMLELMDEYDSLNAEAISGLLNVESSLVNHHLDILRRQDIVCYHLEGKQYFYSVNWGKIEKISNFVRDINNDDE